MLFPKKYKNIFQNLVFLVFSNGIVSEGEKTALRKRTGRNLWLLLVQATRKEVNSNGAIFFPKENHPTSI